MNDFLHLEILHASTRVTENGKNIKFRVASTSGEYFEGIFLGSALGNINKVVMCPPRNVFRNQQTVKYGNSYLAKLI